jgi:hypothetical protein
VETQYLEKLTTMTDFVLAEPHADNITLVVDWGFYLFKGFWSILYLSKLKQHHVTQIHMCLPTMEAFLRPIVHHGSTSASNRFS